MASCWGIPDIWSTNCEILLEKANEYSASHLNGQWAEAAKQLAHQANHEHQLKVYLSTHILNANYQEEKWQLSTTGGKLKAPQLIIAQSPWDTILWLPKDYWPESLFESDYES